MLHHRVAPACLALVFAFGCEWWDFPQQCRDGWTTCGDQFPGCDTRLEEDPDHCGACGRSCEGGPCRQGACEGFQAHPAQAFVRAIATDDTHVYWLDGDPSRAGTELRAAPRSGGASTLLGTSPLEGFDLEVWGDRVYWSVAEVSREPWGEGKILATGADGNTEVIAEGVRWPDALAADAQALYWLERGGDANSGGLFRRAHAGGAVESVLGGLASPGDLAIHGGRLFWTERGTASGGHADRNGKVSSMDLMTGQRVDHAIDQPGPAALAVDDDHVYWSLASAGPHEPRVLKTPRRGGDIVVAAHKPDGSDWGRVVRLASTSESLYLIDASDGLHRAVPDTPAEHVGGLNIWGSTSRTFGLAVDERAVWWGGWRGLNKRVH